LGWVSHLHLLGILSSWTLLSVLQAKVVQKKQTRHKYIVIFFMVLFKNKKKLVKVILIAFFI
jgi:hypothetical protein